MPLQATGYVPQYGDRIAELMMRQGEIAARGAERSGLIWGRAIENIGQIAGHAVEQHQQDKIAKQKDEGIYSVMQSWDGQDPTALVKGLATYIGPVEAVKVAGGLQKLMEAKQGAPLDASHVAGPVGALAALERANPGHLQRNWGLIYPEIAPIAKQSGLPVSPEWSEDMTKGVMTLDQHFNAPKPESPVESVDAQGNPVTIRPTGAQLEAGVPRYVKPEPPPSFQAVTTAAGIQPFNPKLGSLGPVIAQRPPTAAIAGTAPAGDAVILKPGQKGFSIAQDMAYGSTTVAQVRSLLAYNRTVDRVALYDTAKQLNPNFDPAKFDLGYRVAGNPKIRQQVAAQDNVLGMVGHLLDISDKAVRANAPILNKYILPGGVALGNRKYSNLQLARTAFADELAGALGFGSATDMNREMGFDMTNTKLSPADFKAGIEEVVVPFIHQKRATLVNQMGVYGKDIDEMSAGGAKPPSSGPQIGERRMFNGKPGEWDGKGWVDVGGK